MNAHTPFDANQDWSNPYCQNRSNDPMVDALLGNAYHVVRTVYCNLGNLKLIYDFLNKYGMVLGVQSEAELKAMPTSASYVRLYGFDNTNKRVVTDYLYVDGDRTGVIPDDPSATGSWILVATSNSDSGDDGDDGKASPPYIPYSYNNGSAIGGETTIPVPAGTVGVPMIVVEGYTNLVGYGFTYDAASLTVTLAQPLEPGDEVHLFLTGTPAVPDNPNVTDWVQINWLYNGGYASGGEQVIAIPYTFESVPAIYKNGERYYAGLANKSYTVDADNQRILLTEPLVTNDRLIVTIGGESTTLIMSDRTVQEVARSANVKDSEVILSTNTTQYLNGKKVVFDVTSQKIYGLPVLPSNVYIQSVSNGQLIYSPGNVTVGLLPAPGSEENIAGMVQEHKDELASNTGGDSIGLKRTGLANNLATTPLAVYKTTTINAVTDYGMVADFDPTIGVSNGTNNTAAMQQMINDVIAAGGNVTIHIPAGNYRIKRLDTTNPGGVAVTLGTEGSGLTNVVIEGDGFGTVIYNDDIGRLFGLYSANTVTIRNMKVVGYGGGAPAATRERDQAFALGYNSKNVIFDGVYIDNFFGDCLYFGGDLENGTITGKMSRDVTVRNCILKERYGNGIRSWNTANTGTRSRLAIAVIDVVGLKIHDNLIYGEIDLEPNSSGQNMQYVEIHDNTFRAAGVTPVTNPYACEPLYTGTTTIRGGVTLQTVASSLTTASIIIRDNAIEYGRIRITGGSNAARVSCTGNRIRRGGIFLGHYSGTNNNPYIYVTKNQVDGSFNGSDDDNMEDWITVGSIPSAAFFIQGSLSNCRIADNICGSMDSGFSYMFYLLNASQTGGIDLAIAGGRNTWVNNLANNTTALRNYTLRPTDLYEGEVLMPPSGVPRTEVIKQVTHVEITPVADVTVTGTNQEINYAITPSNKYRIMHAASASISKIAGYTEETGMRIQLRSGSASASNTLTLAHGNNFFLKGQVNAVLNSTREVIVMELIEPDVWTEVSRNF